MVAEIKDVARRHLAAEGANLSLRAVARDMGMVSSALYRYFASRDDLLTALILDAYNALGEAVEAADAAVRDRRDLRGRWYAATRAVRDWALAKPAEYALLYGSPVPGYAAPQATVTAAIRTPAVLAGIVADGYAAGLVSGDEPGSPAVRPPEPVRADLARIRDGLPAALPDRLIVLALTSWLQLFGNVSFELFGQFNNTIDARAEFFDLQMGLMADLLGV
jgi:AcrR family transcriptional regulator